MQTGKFTIFDFNKLQDLSQQEHYHEIIKFAKSNSLQLSERYRNNYSIGMHRTKPGLNVSYYIQRANEIIQRASEIIQGANRNLEKEKNYYPSMLTANEKMLFMTSFVFPDNQQFIKTLKFYGIDQESCMNFSEKVKDLCFHSISERTDRLTLLMIEYFENLDMIKSHYGTNNTGIIINKILEIAYLHPELLNQKEKS